MPSRASCATYYFAGSPITSREKTRDHIVITFREAVLRERALLPRTGTAIVNPISGIFLGKIDILWFTQYYISCIIFWVIFLLSISEIVFPGSRKVFTKSAKITTNERNVDAFVCCVELKKPNGPLTPKSPFGLIFYIFAIAGLGTKISVIKPLSQQQSCRPILPSILTHYLSFSKAMAAFQPAPKW